MGPLQTMVERLLKQHKFGHDDVLATAVRLYYLERPRWGMPQRKEQRVAAGFWTMQAVHNAAGVSQPTLAHHMKFGRIPMPSHPWRDSRLLYYTTDEATKIIAWLKENCVHATLNRASSKKSPKGPRRGSRSPRMDGYSGEARPTASEPAPVRAEDQEQQGQIEQIRLETDAEAKRKAVEG